MQRQPGEDVLLEVTQAGGSPQQRRVVIDPVKDDLDNVENYDDQTEMVQRPGAVTGFELDYLLKQLAEVIADQRLTEENSYRRESQIDGQAKLAFRQYLEEVMKGSAGPGFLQKFHWQALVGVASSITYALTWRRRTVRNTNVEALRQKTATG